MQFHIYSNTNFRFFRKPHGLPSTFGKEKSFLDHMSEQKENKDIKEQIEVFGKEKEYGLLNRLDNETAGFLYFAKDLTTFDNYRQLQAQNRIEKYYLAQVPGKFLLAPLVKGGGSVAEGGFINDRQAISFSIMHRSSEKMIAIKDQKDLIKGRGKEHMVNTYIKLIKYDPKTNISTLLVKIHKGIRHQIRVHLASKGFPIIGDQLYGKSEDSDFLHLWSVGFKIIK